MAAADIEAAADTVAAGTVAGTVAAEIEVVGIVIADTGILAAAAAGPSQQLEVAAEHIAADIADLQVEVAVADIEALVVDIEVHVVDIAVIVVVGIEVPAVDTEVVLQRFPALSVAGAHCFRIINGGMSVT